MGAKTIEQIQEDTFRPTPIQTGVMINEFKINNKYRHEAQVHLEKILKPYEHVLDTEWRDLNDDVINAEWVQVPNDEWEKREIRKTIFYLHGGGYYLCSKESHRNITNPIAKSRCKNFSLIANRSHVYCVTLQSPLVDLTDECIDFLPNLAKGSNNTIPYVSPMLAESLCSLPPLLLVAGGDERLRDEAIYFAHRSAEPNKYKGPSYNAGKFEKSPFQTPTNTTLEIYEEMLHVFQGMQHASTTKSYERTVEFINRVTNVLNEPLPPSSYDCINAKGEFGPLKSIIKKS
ncbi:hypothetical protein C1646_803151 [Rhizophagus diaphanus]|nr:hypothetical protein C1646_803151 [Rhizophagus diaphanus] [Rhizophagus sp. MUCL 43196]